MQTQIKKDIDFLASDALEGRRTSTRGEKIAAKYIADRFAAIGLQPLWEKEYLQKYEVVTGKEMADDYYLKIENDTINKTEFGFLPFSAYGEFGELIMPTMKEQGGFWLIAASTVTKKNIGNPHSEAIVDFENFAKSKLLDGAKGLVFYNNIGADNDYFFDLLTKTESRLSIPVVYINYATSKKYILPKLKADWIDIAANFALQDIKREGRNVGGFINNGATNNVFIGAHFDHLGYGEDHNSLHPNKEPAIHNGADDNASGVAAILALAEMLKNSKFKNNNYIIVSFSGEELGLFGSKRFTEMNEYLLSKANYMINIDMLGRYDDAKKSITIGGVGTSPLLIPTIEKTKPFFVPKYDSAGVGPSDHTSFYLKNIPVLFFFTGLHTDYHKPSDDADKINIEGEAKLVEYIYELVGELNTKGKLPFTKTKEPKMEGTRFKVTLGIMPDYTFSGTGVKADGVTEGKAAAKAGLQAGDVITNLGDFTIEDMQTYMTALSKFKKGDATKVIILRGKEKLEKQVLFE